MFIIFRKLILSLSGLILLGLTPFCAYAEIYSWVGKNGVTHYSSEKPINDTKVETLNYTPTKVPVNPPDLNQTSIADEIKANSALPSYEGVGSGTVVMYSTAWCGYCKKARRYFKENSIPFNEYDIEKSSRAKAEHKRYGGSGVPLLLFGQHKMRGFSTGRFEKLYYQ